MGFATHHEGGVRAGWAVNDKRIRRLWRDEGLPRPDPPAQEAPHRYRHARRCDVPDPSERRVGARFPVRCHRRWENVEVAERDRRVRARVPSHRRGSQHRCRQGRRHARSARCPPPGAHAYVRFDNGPEFVAHAVADWCRFKGTDTMFIDPGSPWQNTWIESFNSRLATNCSTAGSSTACSKRK